MLEGACIAYDASIDAYETIKTQESASRSGHWTRRQTRFVFHHNRRDAKVGIV
jgi:hypothetical protein